MRRLEVVFRSEAELDLLQIYHWIYEARRDPDVANRFLDRLVSRCERIGDAPHGGRPRNDLAPGLRTVSFERSAVIAYRVDGDQVEIVNVFYGGGISRLCSRTGIKRAARTDVDPRRMQHALWPPASAPSHRPTRLPISCR